MLYKGPSAQLQSLIGHKFHTLDGFGTPKPYYSGTWTLKLWLHGLIGSLGAQDADESRFFRLHRVAHQDT